MMRLARNTFVVHQRTHLTINTLETTPMEPRVLSNVVGETWRRNYFASE